MFFFIGGREIVHSSVFTFEHFFYFFTNAAIEVCAPLVF